MSQASGGRPDIVGRNAGDLFSLLGRHGPHAFCVLVEAVAPVFDELVIVEVLLDDDVVQRHRKRRIGARAKLEMVLGMHSEPAGARISDDQLRSALHHVDDAVPEQAVGV